MANKLQAYAQLADHTAAQVTTSYQAWTAFLRTAGRLYKYPFPEQLLIYAQRPDATACAEYDFWNERMRRYVRRGSTGIALIDNSGGKPFLRYVFDVADTGGEDETRPQLWKYREEHRKTVSAALERRFDMPIGDGSLPEQLEKISVQFMADYWREHQQDILGIVDGSFLEEYDAYNIGVQFKNAAAVSMTYVLLSRCGLEAEHFFHHEDFLNVFDFNTPDTLTELGTAVSQGSEAVLRQIEVAIKKYERERSAERSAEHGERADIHEGGGLPASQPDPGGAAGPGSGQVREDAPDVSEGASSGAVQPPDAEGDAVPPPAGDRGRGQQPDGADDAGAGESGGGHGAVEGQRPHEVGGADEQLQGPGGGDHPGGADLQLTSIPSEQEQIKAIEEGLSAEAPGPSSISQADIDAVLRQYGGRLRIFTMYQHGISAKDAAAALKKEYGYSGHNYTFPDGASGMVKYSPDTGLTLQCYQPQAEVTVKWPALEKRVRQLIQEGSYLTPEELEKYESDHLEDVPEQEADVPVPAPAPASLDVTDMDVDKVMTDDWGAQGRKQRIFAQYQTGRSDGEIADFLRNEYLGGGYNQQNSGFVTLADGGRGYSYFVYKELRLSRRDKGGTMRHITFEELAGRIRTLIDQGRYLTPEELEQTALTASESTVAHGPEAAPPVPATMPPREITPADIDAALQEWNGDMDSKRRVQQYMTAHARDRATAEWLKNEYGDGLPTFPVTVEGAATDLPWTKVQRRLALLVKEDRFFTQAELDNFEDIDPAAIREQLENGGPSPFVEQVIADVERLAGQEAEQDADAAPTVREIYEKYKPIVKEKVLADQAYQNACKNSDRETALMEGREAVNRAALSIIFPDGTTAVIGAEDFMRLYFDMADFRLRLHREVIDETYPLLSQAPDLSGQPVIREGDTLTVGSGDAAHEVDITVSDEEWQAIQDAVPEKPPRDPLAPAYQPGDTVYLDKTAYEINAIGLFDVELQDPAQTYPVFRSESKERFETLLWQDARNGPITEFLPANLERVHDYFREALTSGLLTDQDKQRIASWLRSGLGNTPIGNRLAEQFADRAETMQLITGETADYFTSTTGIEVKVHDKFSSGQYMGWALLPSVLRALWQQELDGFTHEPVQLLAVHLEGRPAYQVGDKVTFPYGDREISGTIGWIGENSVRLDVGPYSWSHETINRDAFEEALRHDERNAALFAPEAPPAQEFTTETVAVYPAEPNHLPFEVVVQTLKTPEQIQVQPEQSVTDQAPATRNFRITDDDVGVGTQKEKFRRNMEAIYTLQGIELEGRSATPAEQEILSQYVGWGGLPDAFDPDKPGWADEFLELQAALSPEEYASARASTLNAHYTRPTIVKAIYEAVENMGFKTGNILEPSCGIGNFFGLLPESMAASRLYGVELDSTTGRIAQQLYPEANITIQGFEKSEFPDGFFDLAIGNVPFGGYKLVDRRYNKENLLIHDYFFAKTIDKVRSGGVIAFVTSNGISGGTMDKKDRHAREYIARRCNLLGAIRLPCNASLAYAGTEAGMDIVFLQKRDVPLTRDEPLPGWVDVDTLEEHSYTGGDGVEKRGFVTMSRYFQAHPEMVLGKPEITSGPYGAQLVCQPIPGADLAQQLHEAVSHIHGEYREAEAPELDADINEPEIAAIPADPSVKNFSYATIDGEVYYRQNSVMVKPHLTASAKERVKGMVELRDCVRELIDLQMNGVDVSSISLAPPQAAEFAHSAASPFPTKPKDGFAGAPDPDSAIQEKQAELNQLYDAFAKKHGLINDRANRLAFSADSSYYLLCALEVLDEDGRLERKADMFTKRTIKPHRAVTSVDTAMDALAVSIGERACVDLPFMAQLTGMDEEALTKDLRGVIFKDPSTWRTSAETWQTADEYLSGNVRQKLKEAKSAAERDPAYQVNVDALLAAQPKDLDASEIEVRLGATWIDKKYIQQFMYETLKTPYYLKGKIKVSYSRHTAEWAVSNKGSVSETDVAAYSTYGTGRANAYRILEDSLNLRDVRIYDTVLEADGREKRVLNAKETTLAAQKQQALREAFRDWIFKDPQRRQELVRQYNDEMNCIRPREYDGSRIVFSGINPEIQLQPHQVNAIAHVLYGGNTLLAHEVGAGKTFEMIASAMESKRLGLCHKSIFVVPNHLTEQTAAEFLRLYPSANILVTTKRDFEKHRRKKFCARIATGDYDAVIIGHSQFEKIPISYARQERLIFEQIHEITDGIRELKNSGAEKFSVKQLERTKRNLEARLEKLQANHRKDDVVTFEQLGVDMMFVDESDNYKNLFLYTKMRNVAGLAATDAQKSSDMFAKCRYLDEITHNRGVVFATGTPISNSMTEMFTIQRYLQYDRLQEMGMGHFDCWASRFGETVTALELAPEGTGYRARTRFARFFNLPELMNMFKEVADIKTADQLDLPTPEVEYHTVASKPTEIQKEMVKELSKRATKVHSGTVDPREDNMLKITSDGRKLGLDQRIIDPLLPDQEGTKVNRCVENILQCWRDGDSAKLTQLVFCDISTPKAAPSKRAAKGGDKLDDPTLHMLENAIPLEQGKPFTIYEDIRQKLIAGGMAPEQVAFIHEANTDVQKKELFAKVRSGQVRVLIGSTFKMGAGTNVQDLLFALHDLDCPWRPRDLTQRKGRIERRGNKNEKVHVYRYVTEGTFDAYLWQTVENKQKFISQIMTSKSPVRSCEDVDEAALSYAEIKALCAGDPRIKERMELDVDVSRLKVMKAAHQSKQYELEDSLMKYFPEQIRQYQGYIEGLEADMNTLAEHPHVGTGSISLTPPQAAEFVHSAVLPLPTKPKDGFAGAPAIKEIPAPAPAAEGQGEGTAPDAAASAEPVTAAKEVSQGFAGMVIKGTAYEDREAAGAALLEACKEVKDAEPVMIGSYRGFTMSVSVSLFKHKLALKGEMTHEAELSLDIRGNLVRIDHALEKMPDRLTAIKAQLDNLFAQQEAAKGEVGKPFPQEDELREKSARLAELDALLNIDGGHGSQEQTIVKCARPSVLDGLKRPAQPGPEKGAPKPANQER